MAVLKVLKGLNPGQQFPVEGPKAVLGRHPDCDIWLDVGAVSRQHAQILTEGEDFFVEDLNSRNGTFVNGEKIGGRHKLVDNDRIKICDLLFTFHRSLTTKPTGPLDSSSLAALLVDDSSGTSSSTVMSKLDVSNSRESLRVSVNPEAKLKALLEINQNLGTALAVDEVLARILDSLFKIYLQADRGFVVLRDTENGPLIPKAVKHRRAGAEETIRISRTVINQVMSTKQAILSADAASDARFDTSQSIADFRIRSMMCAPLIDSNGRVLGAIQIDTLDQRSRFQQDDLDVLVSVSCQAAFALENAQLHESALTKEKLDRDLQLAHEVQQGFLPSAPPKVEGFQFFDFYEAANQVGGDYFDYVPLSEGRLGVVLADVSGKGMAAALLMARLSGDVRYCLASEQSTAAAIGRINVNFCASGWDDRFVTMVLAVLDPKRNELSIANAGHMAPFLRHADGRVEPIGEAQAGLPLGVDCDFVYEQFTCKLEPNDALVIFTDGISEAMNATGGQFGLERIEQDLCGQAIDVAQLGPKILADVKKFVGNHPQSDDMCLICFGRK